GWYGGNDQSSVIQVPRPVASRDHPTVKPVELIRRCLVNSTAEGDRVLDSFCGSGSTLIAGEVMGRRGYGMEIDPGYCDVAVDRRGSAAGSRQHRRPDGQGPQGLLVLPAGEPVGYGAGVEQPSLDPPPQQDGPQAAPAVGEPPPHRELPGVAVRGLDHVPGPD